MIKNLRKRYKKLVYNFSPRLLTHMSRNSNSFSYGCLDRDWWHYKIRDFPSLILQQGAYSLLLLDEKALSIIGISKSERDRLVLAAVRFWVKRCNLKGYAEEYYPYENGYPPLAFSTLAMAKIVLIMGKEVFPISVKGAFSISARKLLNRIESKAGNQQVAGLASLYFISEIYPDLINSDSLEKITKKTLSLQNPEGWFFEYDGADIGYLSVTLDCLYDIYDCCPRNDIMLSIRKIINFTYNVILMCEGFLSGLNSRNTDYILPYGFVRGFLHNDKEISEKSKLILHRLSVKDIFDTIDDRYWSHYIGHSVIRAANLIPTNINNRQTNSEVVSSKILLPEAGLFEMGDIDKYKVCVSAFKGGAVCISSIFGNTYYDYGWVLKTDRATYTSSWYSRSFKVSHKKGRIKISGNLYPTVDLMPTPLKHFCLRVLSYILGSWIISFLKRKFIFRRHSRIASFSREVIIKNNHLEIIDLFQAKNKKMDLIGCLHRASGFSSRHVASSGSYCDIKPIDDWHYNFQEKKIRRSGGLKIVSQLTCV